MKHKYVSALVALPAFACVFFAAGMLGAQQFDLSWYTFDSGGGYAAGGNFELDGTIGQHDVGTTMVGGNFEITGGFWVGDDGGILLGDVNGDGVVNLLDVAPFVNAIATGTYIPEADVNHDGVVDLLDVQPFVDLLSG